MPNMQKTLLKMMRFAFIEIRACNDIEKCKRIADIFHGVPSAMTEILNESDFEEVYSRLLKKAERHQYDTYIKKLRTLAEK